jgi:peptide/nickel transport system permease protein
LVSVEAAGVRRLVLRRLLTLVPLVWLVVTLTFVVVQLAPGSYADTVDHPRLSPSAREAIRASYGLDLPIHQQYLRWLRSVASGNLGHSFLYKEAVTRLIARALPPTILLAGSALVLDLLLGLILAMAAVRRPHGWFDRMTTVLSLGIYGLPSFWIAGVAVLIFAVGLGWLPTSHMQSVDANQLSGTARLMDLLRHLLLPAACLGLVGAAATARYLRATLLEVRASRHVLAARARGLPEGRILWLHTLRPALLPVITLVGLSLPVLFSGSVVIESVFAWPGMGQLLWKGAQARDLPLIMGATLVGAIAVILGSLVADLLYAVVDPRVRERP